MEGAPLLLGHSTPHPESNLGLDRELETVHLNGAPGADADGVSFALRGNGEEQVGITIAADCKSCPGAFLGDGSRQGGLDRVEEIIHEAPPRGVAEPPDLGDSPI